MIGAPALHRRHAEPGDLRYLRGAQTFEIAQDHHVARFGFQLVQGGSHSVARLAVPRL
jgi:hypothetical protein